MPIRLVIADDHPIILQGLRDLFAQHCDIETTACCATGEEAIAAVERHQPDVLLIDLKMEGLSGLDVVRRLHDAGTTCHTVILTAAARDEEVAAALELGVAGLILKDALPDTVVECVRQVSQGRPWIDRETLGRALAVARQDTMAGDTPQSTLTPRELTLIKLVAEGLRNKEIAERLSITEGTVKVHLHNIYDKLGVDGRLELLLAAQHKRLI
jgi:DNA-binding NarL/FixJ family response regulator